MPIIPEQRGPGIHIKSIEAEGNLSTRYYFGKRASIHLLAWGYDFRTAFASDVSNVPFTGISPKLPIASYRKTDSCASAKHP
jgi:hypothetical protein